jgi:hypothetical protein
MLPGVSFLAGSNVNNLVGLVGLPCVMWSAHFFVTHIQTEKISSWNGLTVHVCCFMLARASTKTFVTRLHIRQSRPKNREKIFVSRKIRYQGHSLAEVSLYIEVKRKGKTIPLQAWTGPEGSRRLMLPAFKTIDT